MVDDATALAAIAVMAVTTLATRFAGVWIMARVALGVRVEAFLRSMATSVLVAIVVPAAVAGPARIWLALAAALGVMIATRSALGALVVGTGVAALVRNLAP